PPRRTAVHRLRAPPAAAPERGRSGRRGRPAARRVPRGAARRPGGGDGGLPELPALHPRVPPRAALALRPARGVPYADPGLEASGLGARRAPERRSGERAGRRGRRALSLPRLTLAAIVAGSAGLLALGTTRVKEWTV